MDDRTADNTRDQSAAGESSARAAQRWKHGKRARFPRFFAGRGALPELPHSVACRLHYRRFVEQPRITRRPSGAPVLNTTFLENVEACRRFELPIFEETP
jgi:hypothetical protein